MSLVYVRALWQFSRPRTLILIWLHILLGYACLSGEVPSWWSIGLALLASMSGYVSAVSFNDISDREADDINLPHQQQANDRPLINGTLSERGAWAVALLSSISCVVACVVLQPWLGVVACAMIGLNIIYSLPPIRIAKRGALAQYLLPIMYVVFPACIASSLAGSFNEMFMWVMASVYMIFVGRLFLKDVRDEDGDRATGKRTFLVRHGLKPTLRQSWVWIVIGSVSLTIRFLGASPDKIAMVIIGVLTVLGVAWSIRACYRAPALEAKLLWVAVVGRCASSLVFCVLVWTIVWRANLQTGSMALLVILTAGVFVAGIGMLYEELQEVMRRQKRQLRQQE